MPCRCRSPGKLANRTIRHLGGHVIVHAIVTTPRFLGRIQIKPGAESEIVSSRRVTWNIVATRTRVRRHQHQSELCGDALRTTLDHEGFLGAGQAREIGEYRHFPAHRLRRHENRKSHRAIIDRRRVPIETDLAAERPVLADGFEIHLAGKVRSRSWFRKGSTRFCDFQIFCITRVALVPPKPKLLLMAVRIPAASIRRVTSGMPSAAGSGSTTLIEGAMKSCCSINRQ